MQLSRLESAEVIGAITFTSKSLWDGLGRFRLFSTVRWSCIGRAIKMANCELSGAIGSAIPRNGHNRRDLLECQNRWCRSPVLKPSKTGG